MSKGGSVSQEDPQTDSKEEVHTISASRPSRKTKEAAKSYLNLLGTFVSFIFIKNVSSSTSHKITIYVITVEIKKILPNIHL